MGNKIKLAVTLSPEILARVTKAAKEQGLSRSAYIEQIIRKYIMEVVK